MSRLNSNEVLSKLLNLCKELDRIPTDKEIANNKVIGSMTLLKRMCQEKNYKDRFDFCRQHGYKSESDIIVNEIIKPQSELTVDDLIILWNKFKDKYGYFPTSSECIVRKLNNYNLPDWDNIKKILFNNNMTLEEFYSTVGYTGITPTKTEDYGYYVEKYIRISNQRGKYLTSKDLINNRYRLPSSRWFVQNCPDKKVKDFYNFIEWCDFIPFQKVSKEKVIQVIYRMQSELGRPLKYDDFRNPSPSEVGISFINKFWGSLNKMKEALGLEVVQEDMISKKKPKDEMLDLLQNYIDELGRLPLCREIDVNPNMPHSGTYHKYFNGLNNAFVRLGYTPNKKTIALRLSDEEIKDIYFEFISELNSTPTYELCSMVYELPSPHTVMRRFECSWNDFISELGFTPNEQKPINPSYAKDGTLCLSATECIIHNYLLDKNIKNIQKEVLYRDFLNEEQLQEKAGLKRCDWLFYYKDRLYIVEYFGLMDFKTYNERHDFKLQLIKDDGLSDNFIAIYPKDINNLDDVFYFLH